MKVRVRIVVTGEPNSGKEKVIDFIKGCLETEGLDVAGPDVFRPNELRVTGESELAGY